LIAAGCFGLLRLGRGKEVGVIFWFLGRGKGVHEEGKVVVER
jgi:hypothetical protein